MIPEEHFKGFKQEVVEDLLEQIQEEQRDNPALVDVIEKSKQKDKLPRTV